MSEKKDQRRLFRGLNKEVKTKTKRSKKKRKRDRTPKSGHWYYK